MRDKIITFIQEFQEMRTHQKNYFRSKHPCHMAKAKKLEKKLDKDSQSISDELKHGEQKTLF